MAISEFTGTEITTDSPAWRHECECRWVLGLPTREDRNGYIAAAKKIRGAEAAYRLRVDVIALAALRLDAGDRERLLDALEEKEGALLAVDVRRRVDDVKKEMKC